ncbi:MAG: hypothetical protein ACLFVU_12435 [Phycisphaerae bacterium]
MSRRFSSLLSIIVFSAATVAAQAERIIVNPVGSPTIAASSIDLPELPFLLYNEDGSVITDDGVPVIYDAFIDTGASSFAISYLSARGMESEGLPSLGLDGVPEGEFVGEFTEIGIGGGETGDVTRPYGVKVLNGLAGTGYSASTSDFIDYGQHSLWVRRQVGEGESLYGLLYDPINIVGMPAIQQRVLHIDPTKMYTEGRLGVNLLEPGSGSIPSTDVTLSVEMRDYLELTTGTAVPSYADNPMLKNITLKHGDLASTDNELLLDTGGSSSFLCFDKARAIGLIPPQYCTMEQFMAEFTGTMVPIGGVGETQYLPIVTLDEFSVQTEEGHVLVWENVELLIVDVPGLPGAVGMNMLTDAVTIDSLGSITGSSEGAFDAIVFDSTDPDHAHLRLDLNHTLPEPTTLLLLSPAIVLLRRRRRRTDT